MENNVANIGTALTLPPENNVYTLDNFKDSSTTQTVTFYKLNADGTFIDGTTLEEMLAVSIIRLNDLNARYFAKENVIAIQKMQEALMWLNKRTEDRQKRGVEGTHQM